MFGRAQVSRLNGDMAPWTEGMKNAADEKHDSDSEDYPGNFLALRLGVPGKSHKVSAKQSFGPQVDAFPAPTPERVLQVGPSQPRNFKRTCLNTQEKQCFQVVRNPIFDANSP
jgi:hypothetical protein